MLIKDMFVKPIDRELRGVIKVGQNDAIQQELEEYVVTKELKRHFAAFFEAYADGINRRTDEMAVWISGFFGSGKSHFLKILAYLLENREVNGKRAIDYFKDDEKIVDETILGNMELAGRLSTDVILFNIDSISTAAGNDKESILPIFRRAFDEKLGYCGRNSHIADLERKLADAGQYELFKKCFEEKAGASWQDSRNEIYFIVDDLVSTLVDIGFMQKKRAEDWYNSALLEYPDSTSDFAKLLKKYLAGKGNNHQVVFLVDEVGQYIGGNSNLMLKLQSLVEDIGIECGSQVWVIVTSQQNVDDITDVKGNDFSKIQGRFKTRLSLSSSNVREVIQKRILRKNQTADSVLTTVYENNQTILKNLINFKNDAELRVYDDAANFSSLYPFIPYQVNLMQKVLTSIRQYSSSGKHLSDGERSMLSLFQLSTLAVMNQSEGELIPLYLFYDALENNLDHNHRMVIVHAEENRNLNPNEESDCFVVNLLKTLFLVKYVDVFDPTLENITTLMVSNINDDRSLLTTQVRSGLDLLVKEALVLKHNGKYIFQTDQEQETTRRIRNIDVSTKEISDKILETIFSEREFYSASKFRYSARNSFVFQQSIDGDLKLKTGYIGINIYTPNYPNTIEMMQTMIENSLYVVLPKEDRRFLDELEYSLKIEKFLIQTANDSKVDPKIRDSKMREKQERLSNALSMLKTALLEANIYSNGEEVLVSGNSVEDRLNQALRVLVDRVFINLSYIKDAKSENDVKTILRSKQQTRAFKDVSLLPNGTALDDLLRYIEANTSERVKLSIKAILQKFSEPPYGYAASDTEWLLAQLFVLGEIELSLNGDVLSPNPENAGKNFDYFTKQIYRDSLLIRYLEKSSTRQRKALQNIAADLFGGMLTDSDDYTLQQMFQEKLTALKDELSANLTRINAHPYYPGKETVETGLNSVMDILNCKGSQEFFTKVVEAEQSMLDFAEDYENIRNFFEKGSKQPELIDQAEAVVLQYEQCRSIIDDPQLDDAASKIREILERDQIISYVQKLPPLTSSFSRRYQELAEQKQKPLLTKAGDVMEEINRRLESFNGPDKEGLGDEIRRKMDQFQADLSQCGDILRIPSFENGLYDLRKRLTKRIQEADSPAAGKTPLPPQEKMFFARDCTSKIWRIETEADLDRYIRTFRQNIAEKMASGTVIELEF